MAWAKIDDEINDNPKWMAASLAARGLWTSALAYSSRNLTDGAIPAAWVRREAGTDADRLAAELVTLGLWTTGEHGYMIHDYLDYNPSKAEVLERRHKEAERKRASSARNPAGIQTDGERNPAHPVPVPVPNENDENPPTVDAPQAARDAPTDPKRDDPPSPKPKTQAQLNAERLYLRRMAIFEAFLRGLGIPLDSLAAEQRKVPSLRVLTTALLDKPECVPEVIEPLARYTAGAYKWRQGKTTPSLAEVLAALPEWDAAGRPDAPPPSNVKKLDWNDHRRFKEGVGTGIIG